MIGYPDIGALQHKDGGGDAVNTGYPDVGALQHLDSATTGKRFILIPFLWPWVAVLSSLRLCEKLLGITQP